SLRYIPSANAISPKKGFEDSLRSKKKLSTKVNAPAASNGLERDVFQRGKFVITDPTPTH
ncbi:MAG: hypothetical protein WCD63_14030, partial [Terrimicrobiaceae bacterium]